MPPMNSTIMVYNVLALLKYVVSDFAISSPPCSEYTAVLPVWLFQFQISLCQNIRIFPKIDEELLCLGRMYFQVVFFCPFGNTISYFLYFAYWRQYMDSLLMLCFRWLLHNISCRRDMHVFNYLIRVNLWHSLIKVEQFWNRQNTPLFKAEPKLKYYCLLYPLFKASNLVYILAIMDGLTKKI